MIYRSKPKRFLELRIFSNTIFELSPDAQKSLKLLHGYFFNLINTLIIGNML
jgi:hypothetical protein